jgi:hypothetical protein
MELDEKVFEKFRSPTSSYLSTLEEVEESKASESTKSAEPVAEKPVAAATAAPAPPSAVEAKVEAPVKPAPKVDSAAAKGGVDLQRPAAVEGVIASFQRKAVESYKVSFLPCTPTIYFFRLSSCCVSLWSSEPHASDGCSA